MSTTTPPVPPAAPAQGGNEEPEIAQEDDIAPDEGTVPEPTDPEPTPQPIDPEKSAVPTPLPGKEHPRQ